MKTDELKQAALMLMETADIAYMTTIDEAGYPNTRAIFNLRNRQQFPSLAEFFEPNKDDFTVYFATNTSSRKMQHIMSTPKISVYYCLPGQFHGMMLAGSVEMINDDQIKKTLWQDGWERYYPKGYKDPDYTVLRLIPLFARGWYQGANFEILFDRP